MFWFHRFLTALILAALLLPTGASHAQQGIRLVATEASYLFEDHLHIEAQFESVSPLVEGQIFIHAEAAGDAIVLPLDLDDSQRVEIDLRIGPDNRFPAFSDILYWFLVTNEDGDFFESEKQRLYYEDNRYEWQSLSQGAYTVHWFERQEGFGTAIISAAQKGVERLQGLLPLEAPTAVEFMVYPSAEEVRYVLGLSGHEWVAGHTDPELGLALLAIPPGPGGSLEIDRQAPHEVAHITLAENLGAEAVASLPLWLVEGLASYAEVYSDPARQQLLELHHAAGLLIPISQLCHNFPQGADQARLAYAEAAAFVEFLHAKAGQAGFEALLDANLANPDCVEAPQAIFGQDLNGLEEEWRRTNFGQTQPDWRQLLADLPWQPIALSGVFALLIFMFFRGVATRRE